MAGNEGLKHETIVISSTPGQFTVKDHNEMIETIDSVISKIRTFKNGSSNLELDNAIKSLLDASGRINNYYKSINNPVGNNDNEN